MADRDGGSNATGIVGVIIGAVIVVALILFFMNGFPGRNTTKVTVTPEAPATAPAPAPETPLAPAQPPAQAPAPSTNQ
jgi:hypothetical protein